MRVKKKPAPKEIAASDSEPEEICFSTGKELANEALREISTGIKSQKDRLKKKRKEIHERNASQKRNKVARLKELEDRKLPDDFLEKISSVPITDGQTVSKENPQKSQPEKDEDDLSTKDIQAPGCHNEHDDSDDEDPQEEEEDFVSLHGTTQFRVAVLDKELKKPANVSAADFKEKMLNRKGVPRETVKEMLSKKEKQAVHGGLNTF